MPKTRPKPQGQITRGKTQPNRLRRVDAFILLYAPDLLRRQDGPFRDAWFVDLGFGAHPVTTLETAERLRRSAPELRILGVDIDPERVARAQPQADARTHFRCGGFNLPLAEGERVRLIRAFNVLRQYPPQAVRPAWEQMARAVPLGGLLLEGTSTPSGALWVMNVLRRWDGDVPWRQEALVFSTNFHPGFDPIAFQAVLPKNYIHRIQPGESIADFFAAWKAARAATYGYRSLGRRQWFGAAARQLAARGWDVDTRRRWINRGYLLWRNPPP